MMEEVIATLKEDEMREYVYGFSKWPSDQKMP